MKESKWIKLWEVADAPVFEMGHGTVFGLNSLKKITGRKLKSMLLFGENEVLSAYHTNEDLANSLNIGKSLFSNGIKFESLLKTITRLIKASTKKLNIYDQSINTAENIEQLKLVITTLSNELVEVFSYFNITNPQYTIYLENELAKHIKDHTIIQTLTINNKLSSIQKEEIEFLTLLAKEWMKIKVPDDSWIKLNLKSLYTNISLHILKYRYINGNEGANKLDIDYYISQIKYFKLNKINPKQKLLQLRKHHLIAVKERNSLINSKKFSSKVKSMSHKLSELGYYRLELRLLWSEYYRILRNAIYKLSRIIKIPAYNLLTLTPNELEKVTHDLDFSKFKERSSSYLFLVKDNICLSYYGEEARSIFKNEMKDQSNPEPYEDIIKGNPAYSGIIEGIAYTFNWSDPDFNKKIMEMPEKAIIVIGNTRPSLMPAIRKASAIITDEGGITSHAAIVSRELRIPCIIGTGDATKLIRTGQKLMVNAEKGFIKIIK